MNAQLIPLPLLAFLLAGTASAQTAHKPLDLRLPPNAVPAASSTAAAPARASTAPGVYYGDTSGRIGNRDDSSTATLVDCDDSRYNQPQVHGSVGTGVVGGNHVSGSYETGAVSISKAFGSCDHPSGGISISVSGGTGNFHSRGH